MKGQKETPRTTASTAVTYLSVVNIGNAPLPKVSRHLYLVNCFHEGMLREDLTRVVFDIITLCSAVFKYAIKKILQIEASAILIS